MKLKRVKLKNNEYSFHAKEYDCVTDNQTVLDEDANNDSSLMDRLNQTTPSISDETIEKNKKSFFYKLKRFIKLPYYYVPPCPECGGYHTGRFVKDFKMKANKNWVLLKSLKSGELVAFTSDLGTFKKLPYNSFCLDCDHQWESNIICKFVSLNTIEQQRLLRGTSKLLEIKQDEIDDEYDEWKSSGGFSVFKKYIGRI